jgi:hypothetical protein
MDRLLAELLTIELWNLDFQADRGDQLLKDGFEARRRRREEILGEMAAATKNHTNTAFRSAERGMQRNAFLLGGKQGITARIVDKSRFHSLTFSIVPKTHSQGAF